MKKFFLALVILAGITGLARANPIALPTPIISELAFDSNNRWFLEIGFDGQTSYQTAYIDSIIVISRSGRSAIKLQYWYNGLTIRVITSDSLYSPLTIDRLGDDVCIQTYYKPTTVDHLDELLYGNILGALIDTLMPGYSITRIAPWGFFKDKSPTLGLPNDTSGISGTIFGRIYDRTNALITSPAGSFSFGIFKVVLTGDGRYSLREYSRIINLENIYYNSNGNVKTIAITPLNINLNPDSLVQRDIHLQSDYLQGINDLGLPLKSEISVANYPNPFNASTSFRVKLPAVYENSDNLIAIYNAGGQKVYELPLRNSGVVTWNGCGFNGGVLASGVYYYTLLNQNRALTSGSIIMLK